jgi:hypothetical protein
LDELVVKFQEELSVIKGT